MKNRAVQITGSAFERLPGQIEVGSTYPVAIWFHNVGDVTARDIRIELEHSDGFKSGIDSSSNSYVKGWQCDNKTLAPRAAYTIKGNFTPIAEGTVFIRATFYYRGGEPVVVCTEAEAFIPIEEITGEVKERLPSFLSRNRLYQVVFSFRSTYRTAVGVVYTPTHPPGFQEGENSCTTTLSAGTTCNIRGTYTVRSDASSGDPVTIGYTLSHAEGSVALETTGYIEELEEEKIVGAVRIGLPELVKIGKRYDLIFSFHSSYRTAVEVAYTPTHPPGFQEDQGSWNPCTTTLSPGATCEIRGSYTAPLDASGLVTVGYTLSHAEGPPVEVQTTGSIKEEIVGKVVAGLPTTDVIRGKRYDLIFSFHSSYSTPVEVTYTPIHPTGFHETHNSCTTTLRPGVLCEIKGSYTAPLEGGDSGPVTVGYILSYAGGPSIELKTTGRIPPW